MLEALAGGVADLQRHDGAGDTAADLAGDAAGFGAAIDGGLALAGDGVEGVVHAGGKAAQGIGMGGLEMGALFGGAAHFVGQLPIDGGEFLDGAAGAFGERGDIGGEDVEIIAVADDAGGHDAGIDGDDAHHLDGAAQVGNRVVGGGDDADQAREIGLFGGKDRRNGLRSVPMAARRAEASCSSGLSRLCGKASKMRVMRLSIEAPLVRRSPTATKVVSMRSRGAAMPGIRARRSTAVGRAGDIWRAIAVIWGSLGRCGRRW